MTQWNKTTLPTETDSDEWNNILVMDAKGMKSVQHYQDYINDRMQEKGWSWMTLAPADDESSITITVSSGERTFTIHKFGDTIELHDSEDPMGQPALVWQDDLGGIDGILAAVETVLVDGFVVAPDDDGKQDKCSKNCKCKKERPRQSSGSIYGAHWAW